MSQVEFRMQNLKQWDELLVSLFNNQIPEQNEWVNTSEIIGICNFIGRYHKFNHMFFPSGGGLDLHGARPSAEPGCIELYFTSNEKSVSILKPDRLIFQSFGALREWAYFRLETKPLQPTGVYESYKGIDEELTEITRGNYVERSWWDAGFYGHDEEGAELPLPCEARVVTRHLNGSFVIFAKGSAYNADPSTYDGRHSKMSANRFRDYIGDAVTK